MTPEAIPSDQTAETAETGELTETGENAAAPVVENGAAVVNDPGERLSGQDDLEARFADHLNRRARSALIDEARARIEANATAAKAAAEPPSDDDEIPPGMDPSTDRPTGQFGPAADTAGRDPRTGTTEKRVIDAALGALEIGIDLPRSVVGGVRDAFVEFGQAIADLVKFSAGDAFKEIEALEAQVAENVGVEPDPDEPTSGETLLGKVPKPKTATGNVVRGISQFITGFVAGGKGLTRLRRAPAKTAPGQAVEAGAKGAFSDAFAFDPNDKRLADLLAQNETLAKFVPEFLESDPTDSDAGKRFKRALEGVIPGAFIDGFLLSMRAVRARRRIKASVAGDADPLTAARQEFGEVTDADLAPLGTLGDDAFVVRKFENAEAATAQTDAATVTGRTDVDLPASGIEINFARIDTPEDVQDLLQRTIDLFAGDVGASRRGVRSNEATQEAADALGLSVEDLLRRRGGQPLNAEESLAARRLWTASAEKLLEVAERAAGPNASQTDQFIFRKMLATHYAIQAEVIGARTETARALQAWRIPVEGVERARAIQNLLEASGGTTISQALAKRLAVLKQAGVTVEGLNVAVRRGAFARGLDAVRESFVLGLLWSPKTHLVNMGSNTIVAFQQIMERGAAAQISTALGREASERGVVTGEGLAMTYGLISGLKDGFRASGRALILGERIDGLGKLDLPRESAISSEAFNLANDSALGRAVDFMGFATRFSGDLMGAEDAFFKTIGFRMEVHAQALRQATQEGHKGSELAVRIQELVTNPPENIRIGAADAAAYNTFTNQPGQWASAILQLRNVGSLNPTFVVLPFVRTPANILRYAFERTPLAPLVGQWRADIAAGGARSDIALARMATGSAIMALFADYANSGYISGNGPSDAGKRAALTRQGWQRNAVWRADPDNKEGGTWINYNRLDPFGNAANFAASMAEILKTRDLSPEDMDEVSELMAMAVAAVSSSVVDKSYFEGVSRVFHALEEPKRFLPNYFERTLASFVPFSTAVNTVRQAQDPKLRDANGVWEQIQSRLPGLSERLPLALDLWGRERGPKQVFGRAFDVLSPLYATSFEDSPIDAEITRLNIGVRRIAKKTVFAGADVNFRDWPRVYERYVQLAGNGFKHPVWNLGAKDYLDAVVSGDHPQSQIYNIERDGPDGGKASFIKSAIQDYRREAQALILVNPAFSDFAAFVREKQFELQQNRAPVGITPPRTPRPQDAAPPQDSSPPRPGGAPQVR